MRETYLESHVNADRLSRHGQANRARESRNFIVQKCRRMDEDTPALVKEKRRCVWADSTQLRRYVIVGVYPVEVPEDVGTDSEAQSTPATQANYSLLI